jgi:hypothetical protein
MGRLLSHESLLTVIHHRVLCRGKMVSFHHQSTYILLLSVILLLSNFHKITTAVKPNTLLDLSVFGECVIHFTKMQDDWETIDRTESIIHAQYQSRENHHHQLISIYNSSFNNINPVNSLIQPSISIMEECTLNVLLGVHWNQHYQLAQIIEFSNYTYSSEPFSTYVLILDSRNHDVYFDSWGTFPTRIFYFKFPSPDSSSIGGPHFINYLCLYCAGSPYIRMHVTQNLSSASYLNLRSMWVKQEIVFRFNSVAWRFRLVSAQETTFRKTTDSQCEYGLVELMSKATEPNMTVIMEPLHTKDTFYSGYTGKVFMHVFYQNAMRFSTANSCWYEDLNRGTMFYCTCKLTNEQTLVYEGWIGSFTPKVWFGIFITIVSVSIIGACKASRSPNKDTTSLGFISRTNLLISFLGVLSLFLRQGQIKKNLMMSLCALTSAILLAFYENFMTSAIISPEPPKHHSLRSLIEASYILVYTTHSNDDEQRLVLENELLKSNVKYDRGQIMYINISMFESVKATDSDGNYLSYFDWYTEDVAKSRLSRMQLTNPGCKVFISNYGFPEIPKYNEIHHFLRFRLYGTMNRLQANGLHYFYRTRCTSIASHLRETEIKRRVQAAELENGTSSTSLGIEFGSPDYISWSSLSALFCLVGIWVVFSILVFILTEIKLVNLSVYRERKPCSRRNRNVVSELDNISVIKVQSI